jgi:hypothetical protein
MLNVAGLVDSWKTRNISEVDISNAAHESQEAGYEAMSDRVLRMTGLDMKNAEDRAKLCDMYDIDMTGEDRATRLGSKMSDFERALQSYEDEGMDERSRGDGRARVSTDELPKDKLIAAADRTYERVSSDQFASEMQDKFGLDMNDKSDRSALQDRIKYLASPVGWGKDIDDVMYRNPMLDEADRYVDYAKDHHVNTDKDTDDEIMFGSEPWDLDKAHEIRIGVDKPAIHDIDGISFDQPGFNNPAIHDVSGTNFDVLGKGLASGAVGVAIAASDAASKQSDAVLSDKSNVYADGPSIA